MSNGELGTPKGPLADVRLDPSTLMGAVSSQTLAVENAAGDVKGAQQRLRDDVTAAQRKVEQAQDQLTDEQAALRRRLEELDLPSRLIDFTGGTALGAVDLSEPEHPHLESRSKEEPLAGSGGTITDVEVGTFLGKPITPADSIVLLVDMDDGKGDLQFAGLPGYRYAVLANAAEYTISEVPQREDEVGPQSEA